VYPLVMTLLKSQQQIKHITILGGGLTGLTTAYRLAQVLKRRSDIIPKNVNAFGRLSPDARITLVEKSNRLGGWVHSRRRMIDIPNDAAGPIKEIAGQSMEVILERGPRSIRPKGGKAAAMMLKLVSEAKYKIPRCTTTLTGRAR
jgi:oxygen-dependent protoporphyrinogen oxidase